VEQDHRAVKRVTRPMLGWKAFAVAQGTLTGIVSCICSSNNRWVTEIGEEDLTVAEPFYALAASSSPSARTAHLTLSPHHTLPRNPPQSLMSPTRCKETARPASLTPGSSTASLWL
jgi:hypothetical protein